MFDHNRTIKLMIRLQMRSSIHIPTWCLLFLLLSGLLLSPKARTEPIYRYFLFRTLQAHCACPIVRMGYEGVGPATVPLEFWIFVLLEKTEIYSQGRKVVKMVLQNVFQEFHWPLGCTAAAVLPKLSENILQHLFHNMTPPMAQTVQFFRLIEYYKNSTQNKYRVVQKKGLFS